MSRTRRSRSTRAPATSAGERARVAGFAALALVAGVACQAGTGSATGAGGSGAAAGGAGGAPTPLVLDPIPDTGYIPGELGGYQLGRLIPASQIQHPLKVTSSVDCHRLRGIVRDFRGALPAVGGSLQPDGHPDFEVFEGKDVTRKLVGPDLNPVDGKPVYTGTCPLGAPKSDDCPFGAMTTTAANFDQWYTSHEGVNMTYFVYFDLAGPTFGTWTFSSTHFFPLDDAGFGNSGLDGDDKTKQRNYSFTTEIHTTFLYNGGERFTFTGDDDVWIFVNGKLAVDLGGLHDSVKGIVDLDAQAATLGIQKGSIYPLDLFHAERHSVKSDFGFDMTFQFLDCGYIIP